MLYLFVCCFFLFSVNNVKSASLISLGDVSIPTKPDIAKVGQLQYVKRMKDKDGIVELKFRLDNAPIKFTEITYLEINGLNKTVPVIDNTNDLKKDFKIYIFKVKNDTSISYSVKFIKLDEIVLGNYILHLSVNDQKLSAMVTLNSLPIVEKFTKSKLGLEGDPMRIICKYEAYPDAIEIRWERLSGVNDPDKVGNVTFANSTKIEENDRFKINKTNNGTTENNIMVITSLSKNDTGLYMCTIISSQGQDIGVIYINVKDRWAALYPFMGIVIEVILLVTAILAYERYQIRSQNKKNYGETNDEDNKEPGIPLATGGGDDDTLATDHDIAPVEMDVDKKNNVDSSKLRDTTTTKNV